MVEKSIPPTVSGGGAGFRRLLKDIEDRYRGAFADLGPGAPSRFKHLVDCVDGFLDLLADPKTDFRVKLMDYAKVRVDVAEFCRYYARRLGTPLTERLKQEIVQILEEALGWWGRQGVYNEMEG